MYSLTVKIGSETLYWLFTDPDLALDQYWVLACDIDASNAKIKCLR